MRPLLALPMVLVTAGASLLTGCSASFAPAYAPPATASSLGGIRGVVHGGQQPIGGSHVYVFAVGTGGYGTASRSLLLPGASTVEDGNGNYYVTSDASGSFSVTDDYVCIAGTQVYLYALGGDPGGGSNAAIGLLAGLGQCPTNGTLALAVPYVMINEVSTIATAYALAGFATDATHIASANTALAATGTANAMANIANLISISGGDVLASSPSGAANNPVENINTLANILAACVNSNGMSDDACSTLFSKATGNGLEGQDTPVETATAAINLAHFPFNSVATLYDLQGTTPPFGPALTSAPSDLTLSVFYTQTPAYLLNRNFSQTNNMQSIAIAFDSVGASWVLSYGTANGSNFGNYAHISAAGQVLANVYSLFPTTAETIGIDSADNVWGAASSAVVEISSGGTVLSPAAGYTCPGMNIDTSFAFGANGLVYVGDEFPNQQEKELYIWELSRLSGSCAGSLDGGAYAPTGNVAINSDSEVFSVSSAGLLGTLATYLIKFPATVQAPQAFLLPKAPGPLAVDGSNDLWTVDAGDQALNTYSSAGVAVSPASGYTGGGYTLQAGETGVTAGPAAMDGAGSVWVPLTETGSSANSSYTLIAGISNRGAALTPSTGLFVSSVEDIVAVAPDGSGNLWGVDSDGSLIEYLGLTTPVATPILYNQLGKRP